MKLSKLFIGGYQEIKRPVNVIDDTLLSRMEEARRRLDINGQDVRAVIGPNAVERTQEVVPDLIRMLGRQRPAEPQRGAAIWPHARVETPAKRWPVVAANDAPAANTAVDRASNA